MNRNEVTTMDSLMIGDIFYKLGDVKKVKLQLHKRDDANKRMVCVSPEVEPQFRDKEFLHKWLKPNQQVVYLRSTQLTDIGDPTLLLPTEQNIESTKY